MKSEGQEWRPKLRFPEFENSGEWVQRKLRDIAQIVMGSSPPSEAFNGSCKGLPFMQGNADIQNGFSAPRLFTSEITKECQVGDTLLSVRAPVGAVAKSTHHACIGRGLAAIRANSNNSQEYIHQWLIHFEPRWKAVSQGGTFEAVNSGDVNDLIVSTPSQPTEQTRIADCLSSLDALIAAQAQKLEALRGHKRGLTQRLFPAEGERTPRLRFPEFEGAGDWEEKKLGDISQVVRGGSPRPIDDFMTTDIDGLNWLKIGDVSSDAKYITGTKERVIASALKKTRQISPSDLILSNSMSFGRPYISNIKTCIHDGWIAITKINKDIDKDYLYYVILSEQSQSYFAVNAAGAVVQNLNADIIKLLPVKHPNLPEQSRIADCLSSLDSLISAQADKIAKLKTFKRALMQQLFPGPDELIEG